MVIISTWTDVNSGKPANTDLGDLSVIAGRIDNIVTGLNGTNQLSAIKIGINGGTSSVDYTPVGATAPNTGAFTTVTTSGVVSIDDTTEATSTTAASIHTDGGMACVKKAIVGTDLSVGGNSLMTGTLGVTGVVTATAGVATAGNEAIKTDIISASVTYDASTSGTVTIPHGQTVTNLRGYTFPCLNSDVQFTGARIASTNIELYYTNTGGSATITTYLVIFYV